MFPCKRNKRLKKKAKIVLFLSSLPPTELIREAIRPAWSLVAVIIISNLLSQEYREMTAGA